MNGQTHCLCVQTGISTCEINGEFVECLCLFLNINLSVTLSDKIFVVCKGSMCMCVYKVCVCAPVVLQKYAHMRVMFLHMLWTFHT